MMFLPCLCDLEERPDSFLLLLLSSVLFQVEASTNQVAEQQGAPLYDLPWKIPCKVMNVELKVFILAAFLTPVAPLLLFFFTIFVRGYMRGVILVSCLDRLSLIRMRCMRSSPCFRRRCV